MVTEATGEVFAVVFGVTSRGELEPAMELLATLLQRHASASQVDMTLVSASGGA